MSLLKYIYPISSFLILLDFIVQSQHFFDTMEEKKRQN